MVHTIPCQLETSEYHETGVYGFVCGLFLEGEAKGLGAVEGDVSALDWFVCLPHVYSSSDPSLFSAGFLYSAGCPL